MTALLLAAGYATRLYPLTKNFPKPLLDVQGKPVISWLVDDLEGVDGIDRYVLVSNHSYVGHFQAWYEKQKLSRPLVVLDDGTTSNEKRLGAVKDLLFSIETLHLDDDLLVLAGDNVLEFSLKRFARYFHAKQASCVMRHREDSLEKLQRTGVAEVDDTDRVLSMEEKPREPKSHWAVPPFYCFRQKDIAVLPEAVKEGCPTDAPGSFISWACSRFPVYAMRMPGRRYDIGTVESYELVRREYKGIQA